MPDIVSIVTIMGAAEAGHAAEESAGIAALGIDPLAILAQAGTFLLLFFIVKKFALSKIVDSLERRRKTIDDGIRLGRQMEAEKAKLDEKVEAALREARQEADRIIAAGHEEAGAILKEAEQSASRKSDAILAEAQAKISEDIEKARKGLEAEVLSLVADATEAIIGERMDAKKDAELLNKAIKQARSV